MSKKIAIIGAGASGIAAVKCCLEEELDPVCYERTGNIGGLWYFTEEVREGQACVSKSTIINTCKEMMCYSDFPTPKEFPIFLHNTYVQKYFNMYADNFDVKRYVRFHTEVLMISRTDDFKQTGQWKVEVRDKQTGKTEANIFDGVLVCTGHHADKNVPHFFGMDEFAGHVQHSHDYKDTKEYEGKRVVIIGLGNSGGDAAVELSRVASQVYVSTRTGAWLFFRVADNGRPTDMTYMTRFATILQDIIPISSMAWLMKRQLNQRTDHDMYCLRPNFSPGQQHPLCNDDLPNRMASGSVKIKADIKRVTKTGVEFVDGSFENNIDAILLATGYIFGFPFIDKSVIDVKGNKLNLFKYMFPPDLEKHTLAIIGCIQPIGSTIPIAEIQSRLACRVLKGDVILPSRQKMWTDIRTKDMVMSHRYVKSQRHTIQVDFIRFMDEIAELNGCKPDIKSLFFSDFKLWSAVLFGPCSPYQYRLVGPHKWNGARDAILSQWDRIMYPLRTRPLQLIENSQRTKLVFFVVFVAILAYLFMSYLLD